LPKKKSAKEAKAGEVEVPVVVPEVCIDHDDHAYSIEVELPGVKKEDVKLSVGEQSFCVEGSRGDVVFVGCFSLVHSVDEDKAKAKFESGLLKIDVPLKAAIKGRKIAIE